VGQIVSQQSSEPSGLLVAGLLFGVILGWILLMGAIALLRQHGIGWVVQAVGRGCISCCRCSTSSTDLHPGRWHQGGAPRAQSGPDAPMPGAGACRSDGGMVG
jgi:hypothetical protein